MRSSRISLALLSCLLLAVTGQAMAFARGAAPVEDRAMICAGDVLTVIYLDAEGRPTVPPELCGDCVHVLSALLVALNTDSIPQGFSQALSPLAAYAFEPGLIQRSRTARAPPL